MSLQDLLGEMSAAQFVAEYYGRLPFSRAGGATALRELGTWQVLEEILSGQANAVALPEAQEKALPPAAAPSRENSSPDALVARHDQLWPGGTPSADEARQLFADGYTILVRHAERHHAGLAQLAASFAADLAGPVDVHLYATPAGYHGFGWHYDAEEVFILQTQGKKEFSLRKNTVNPWPLVETIPADMQYHRELMPLMKCLLSAGDWLYIPAGYWHLAQAAEESISLAVGVMAPAAIDLVDFLRRRLVESILWRQRLPATGRASPLSPEELKGEYRRIAGQLAEDLQKQLTDERFLQDFLRRDES